MDLELTQDQELLQRSAADFFARELPSSLVRELQAPGASGHDEGLWRKMAETGWVGLAIPREYGGGGATLLELGLLYEEAGRALAPTTLYSTMYAALLITALGTEEQKKRYLTRIAQGEMIGTVAYAELQALHNPDYFQTTAVREGEGWRLTGTKAFVPNAHLADPLIVVARDGASGGLTAFLVESRAQGLSAEPHQTFGKDRQSLVRLEGVRLPPAAVLGGDAGAGKAEPAFEQATQQATALQCVEMAGGARKILEMTVAYVSQRRQFGVPIGSFQAVQHHLANVATAVDGARLAAYQAVSLLSEGSPCPREVAIAKAWASEAYKNASVIAHQVWGGIGYTTEVDLHLYSNRAKATELTFGTRDFHLRRLGDLLAGVRRDLSS